MQAKQYRRQTKRRLGKRRYGLRLARTDGAGREVRPTGSRKSANDALDPAWEQQLAHARAMCAARNELIALLEALPSRCREHVIEDDPAARRNGHPWPLERLAACYDRLALYASAHDDAALAGPVRQARSLRQRMDRAREALILGNMGIVPCIVREFFTGAIPFGDLVQEGYLGLLKAVDRFDPEKGFRFSTYAYWWIRRALSDAFNNRAGLIRLPDSLRKDLRDLRRVSRELRIELHRPPTHLEISARMGISLRRVKKLASVAVEPSSLEELFRDDGWDGLIRETGTPDPLDTVLDTEFHEKANEALKLLNPRERKIIRLRFGFEGGNGLTLNEIGRRIGLSRERVRQIEAQALAKIQSWANHIGIAPH